MIFWTGIIQGDPNTGVNAAGTTSRGPRRPPKPEPPEDPLKRERREVDERQKKVSDALTRVDATEPLLRGQIQDYILAERRYTIHLSQARAFKWFALAVFLYLAAWGQWLWINYPMMSAEYREVRRHAHQLDVEQHRFQETRKALRNAQREREAARERGFAAEQLESNAYWAKLHREQDASQAHENRYQKWKTWRDDHAVFDLEATRSGRVLFRGRIRGDVQFSENGNWLWARSPEGLPIAVLGRSEEWEVRKTPVVPQPPLPHP